MWIFLRVYWCHLRLTFMSLLRVCYTDVTSASVKSALHIGFRLKSRHRISLRDVNTSHCRAPPFEIHQSVKFTTLWKNQGKVILTFSDFVNTISVSGPLPAFLSSGHPVHWLRCEIVFYLIFPRKSKYRLPLAFGHLTTQVFAENPFPRWKKIELTACSYFIDNYAKKMGVKINKKIAQCNVAMADFELKNMEFMFARADAAWSSQ